MKTKEELNALKEEVEALNKKLAELTAEEMEQVTGGNSGIPTKSCPILEKWLMIKNDFSDEEKKKFIQRQIHHCYDPNITEGRPCDNCDLFKTYQALKNS